MRRFLPLALMLLAACCSARPAQPMPPATRPFGARIRLPDGSSAFPIYRDLGVRFLQQGLNWGAAAPQRPANPRDPSDPAYRWPRRARRGGGRSQGVWDRARAHGRQFPPVGQRCRGPTWVPKKGAYADFLTAASRRYGSVDHWMIWGETNRSAVFRPLPPHGRYGPRRYARLLAAAYRALKRQSRRNVVIGGMTFSFGEVFPGDFVRFAKLRNGKPPPLDWWGHNPFTVRFPDLSKPERVAGTRDFSDLDLLHRDLRRAYLGEYRRFRRRAPRLWLSEFTIPSDHRRVSSTSIRRGAGRPNGSRRPTGSPVARPGLPAWAGSGCSMIPSAIRWPGPMAW